MDPSTNSKSDATLAEEECLATISLVPQTDQIGALCVLKSPKVAELAETTPLVYIVGGIMAQLRLECKDFQTLVRGKHQWLVFCLMIVAVVALHLPLVLLVKKLGASELLTRIFSVSTCFAFVMVGNEITKRWYFRGEKYQQNAQAFRDKMSQVVETLSNELETTAYAIELSWDDRDSQRKLLLKVYKSNVEDESRLPPIALAEGESMHNTTTELPSNMLALFVMSLRSRNPVLDKWILGGLDMQLQATERKVAKCKRCATHFLLIPTTGLWVLALLWTWAFATENPLLLLTYLAFPVLILLAAFVTRWLQECFDMKHVHAAKAAVVEELSRDLFEPRTGHCMTYQVKQDRCFSSVFTRGVVKIETTDTTATLV